MRHLYIHVPFCARRCVYCDFAIAVRREIPAEEYVRAVVFEHEFRQEAGEWDAAPLETLYLGGGTPSLLPPARIAELVRHFVSADGTVGSSLEITIEANPDDVTQVSAEAWAAAGVNRVSLGVQSFHDTVLEWMHRTHVAEQAEAAVRVLRDSGIDSISLDLIAALPPKLERDFAGDLFRAIDLEPNHMSVYGLTAEPRTALSRWVARDAVRLADDELYSSEFLLANDILAAAGFEHYEVSNYAKPGCRSRHNVAYWDGSTYGGLGPSAHGFDGLERRWNVAPWTEYQRRIENSTDTTEGRETLDPGQANLERTFLGLRMSDGLPIAEMDQFDASLLAEAESRGWGKGLGERWRLTPLGWLRLDELVAALTTSPEGA